jgi:hypothetical protein
MSEKKKQFEKLNHLIISPSINGVEGRKLNLIGFMRSTTSIRRSKSIVKTSHGISNFSVGRLSQIKRPKTEMGKPILYKAGKVKINQLVGSPNPHAFLDGLCPW